MEVNAQRIRRVRKCTVQPENKRVIVSARVSPHTKAYLERMGAMNLGRAIDTLVGITEKTYPDAASVPRGLEAAADPNAA